MEAATKFCAHCGWGNPEMIAKGKRMRLEGCGMMFGGLLACGGGCTVVSYGQAGELGFALLLYALVFGVFGVVKWWIGLGFYDGR